MIDCMLDYLGAHAPALYTCGDTVIDSRFDYSVQHFYAYSSSLDHLLDGHILA